MLIRKRFTLPQIIISVFIAMMFIAAFYLHIPINIILNDVMVRLVMNGVLVLSLVPIMNAGIGINFGLPVAVMAGLLGMCVAVNFRFNGLAGFFIALGFSIPFSVLFGTVYSYGLNRVKGKEEIASAFIGFSVVSAMNIFWATALFSNPVMLWPIGGKGMRPTITLEPFFAKALNRIFAIHIGECIIPAGMILLFGVLCLLISIFFKTKIGKAITALGENEIYAVINGISVGKTRAWAIILSTILGGFGIIVYAQSYGFIELYDAPLLVAFPAAASILIGGAIIKSNRILQAIVGTLLFQTIYILSSPIANELLLPESAEILRMFIANAAILYALTTQRPMIR